MKQTFTLFQLSCKQGGKWSWSKLQIEWIEIWKLLTENSLSRSDMCKYHWHILPQLAFYYSVQTFTESKRNLNIPYCEDQQTSLWRFHTTFSTQHDCQSDNNMLVHSPLVVPRTNTQQSVRSTVNIESSNLVNKEKHFKT